MSERRSRAVSLIVLIIFSLVIFSSSLFIITHADHNCTGEDCTVCMELALCNKTLHTLGTTVGGVLHLMMTVCVIAVFSKIIIAHHNKHTTLISLKVELLN